MRLKTTRCAWVASVAILALVACRSDVVANPPRPVTVASTSPIPTSPPATGRTQSAPAQPSVAHCVVSASVTAPQVVLVISSGTSATVSACTRTASGWRRDLGPYYGHVGYTGVTSARAKREGDGHTPAGTYSLLGGFGLAADPGLAQGWKPVRRGDVWVDDSGSRLYNTRETNPANGRWHSAESLEQPGAYDLAQVIDYNSQRVPAKGSAIFLHVDQGHSTAGCVAIAHDPLVAVMRWERRGAVISVS